MSRSNASPIKGSSSPSGGNTVSSVSNAAFNKLAERGMTGSNYSGSRPGTPASPRPHSPNKPLIGGKTPVVTLGVCAMDVKARSKAMREILTRLVEIERGGVDVQIFGDVVILEEGESSLPLQVVTRPSHAPIGARCTSPQLRQALPPRRCCIYGFWCHSTRAELLR